MGCALILLRCCRFTPAAGGGTAKIAHQRAVRRQRHFAVPPLLRACSLCHATRACLLEMPRGCSMRSRACGSPQQRGVQRTVACSRCPACCLTLTHSTPLPAARPRRLEALRQLVPHTERANTANFLEEVVGYVQRLQVRWGVQHALPHLRAFFCSVSGSTGGRHYHTPASRWRLLPLFLRLLAPQHGTRLLARPAPWHALGRHLAPKAVAVPPCRQAVAAGLLAPSLRTGVCWTSTCLAFLGASCIRSSAQPSALIEPPCPLCPAPVQRRVVELERQLGLPPTVQLSNKVITFSGEQALGATCAGAAWVQMSCALP